MGSCEVKVCRICFATDGKLYHLHENMHLYRGYEAVTGLMLADEEDLPPYLCTSCADRLMNFVRFRNTTLQAHSMLQDILKNHDHISVESIQAIIRTIHEDADIERTEDERLGNAEMEIKHEDILSDTIAQLRDEIETECKPDDGADDDVVGDEAVAPCVETNDVVSENEFDEISVSDVDDSELGIGPEEKLITVGAREETEDTEISEMHTQNVTFSCDLCGYKNYNETQFLSHLRAHGESTTQRNTRDYKIKSKKSKSSNTTHNRHMCDTCGQSFSTIQLLTAHLPSHVAKDACDMSKKSIRWKTKLNSHNLDPLKLYPCEICKKTFTSKLYLNRHTAKHKQKQHKCDICGSSFCRSRNLKRHVLVHTNNKQYSCDVCDRSFHRKDHLQVHMQLHTRDKHHKCGVCQKSLPTRSALVCHMRGHDSNKRYTCDVCKKSFRHKSNYNNHLLLHSNDKPFSCDVCQKSYRSKNDVKRHLVVHSRSKVYKCEICKKSFSRQNSRKRHMLVHSGGKPFSCAFCEKSFRTKSNLQCHVKRMHS